MPGLFQEPGRYDFHQALRLLENGAVPGIGGRPIGHDSEPKDEVARLRASTSLGFPTNAIESLERRPGQGGARDSVEVTVGFMGSLGSCGALPWHYTEYVYECLARRDRSFREFIDALEHRSLAFYYRAWRKYRLPFAFEAAHRDGGVDDVTAAMQALVGLGTEHLKERLAEGADRWVFFAGLFARGQRTTAALEAMLQAICGHQVRVQEFVGRWQSLLPEERSRLGGTPADSRNALGESLILGERVWDVLAGVRIRIGPVGSRALADLVRTGRHAWLGKLVQSYLGPDLGFEIVGVVDQASIRGLRLGADGGTRLGGSSWIDATDVARYDSEVPICSSR